MCPQLIDSKMDAVIRYQGNGNGLSRVMPWHSRILAICKANGTAGNRIWKRQLTEISFQRTKKVRETDLKQRRQAIWNVKTVEANGNRGRKRL